MTHYYFKHSEWMNYCIHMFTIITALPITSTGVLYPKGSYLYFLVSVKWKYKWPIQISMYTLHASLDNSRPLIILCESTGAD